MPSKPGETVRQMLAERSTEQTLTAMDPGRALTDEEQQARKNKSQAFWRSVARRGRRRPWK